MRKDQKPSTEPFDVLMQFNADMAAGRLKQAIVGIGDALQGYAQSGSKAKVSPEMVLALQTAKNVAELLLEQKKIATKDTLTGISNRAGFNETFQYELQKLVRHDGLKDPHAQTNLALVMIDLDGFKAINDNMGHSTGDEALMIAAQRLETVFRKTDTVSRLGGDEFTLLLPYDEGEKFNERKVKQKIHHALDGLVFWKDNRPYPITASIGTATYDHEEYADMDIEAVMQDMTNRADTAMYRDKRANKHKRQNFAITSAKAALEQPGPHIHR